MELTYRPFEERDLPGVLRLWEDAGWGPLSEARWREWFVDTPEGPCLVTIAEDVRGEVAGQLVFSPARALANGREERALRLSAPVLRRDVRGARVRSLEHPAAALYLAGAEVARERGFGLVYAFPELAWLPVFQWDGRFATATFATAALPFAAAAPVPSLSVRPVRDFGPEYDALWRSAVDTFPITTAVVRSRDWLRFRNGGRVAVEMLDASDGSLAGFASVKTATGLLMDVLARSPAGLAPVLAATAHWLSRNAVLAPGVNRLSVMDTPALRPALGALGLERADFKFLFTCAGLGPSPGVKEDMKAPAGAGGAAVAAAPPPESWYCMPGD